jgi:hypothetical protein
LFPAVAPSAGSAGERAMTSVLLPVEEPHVGGPRPTTS